MSKRSSTTPRKMPDHLKPTVPTKDSSSIKEDSCELMDFEDLFFNDKDEKKMRGTLFKFKPGISANFLKRYVEVSQRAFRYFENKIRSF